MSLSWYSIQLARNGSTVFDGFFSVNNTSHIVQEFYDSTNPTVNIRSTGHAGGPTYLYYPGWLCFDGGGCNITSFPYSFGATPGDYNLYGSTTSPNGEVGGAGSFVYAFAPISGPLVCFKEGTKIRTIKGTRLIQELRAGDLVLTHRHGFVPIYCIGYRPIHHVPQQERIKDQLYVCRPTEYPELTEDLVITGCHSLLVDDFKGDEKEKTKDVLGDNYVTDGNYRLPACVDQRAVVYEKEESCLIYHFALEHTDYYMNYGIYANGLLVETTSKRYIKELSNMILL